MFVNWVLIIVGALCVLVKWRWLRRLTVPSDRLPPLAAWSPDREPRHGLITVVSAWRTSARRWLRARLRHTTVASNADAVVGQRALVVQRVAEHAAGQVRVRDEVWRAAPAPGASGPFEPGAEVTVEGVDGVTLRVR
jgi:membrane protein implicated in regulation of membrane protease activity